MVVKDPGQPYKNIGAKTLRNLLSTPEVVQELSPDQYSGMKSRARTATWTGNERLVYAAVQEGYTSLDSLPVATGLTSAQISAAVSSLASKGVVSSIGVESDKL